jgi:hypothetical protein
MSKGYIQKLAWVRKKIEDPYNAKCYIDLELFVPKPTRDNPYPCILVSVRNGHSKLFFRLRDVSDFVQGFSLSRRMKEKLKDGLAEANLEADQIEQDMKLVFRRRHLKPGEKIVSTETGEIIAEAENMRGRQ